MTGWHRKLKQANSRSTCPSGALPRCPCSSTRIPAAYGDTIRLFGYYFSLYGYHVSSIPGKNVTLYIDNTTAGTVTTDDIGSYSLSYFVGKVTAGTHVIHAESGLTQSDDRSLAILPVDSVTTLAVKQSARPGEVICTGTVMANLPVRNASVDLVWDTTHVSRTLTNAQGAFTSSLSLPAGWHTVQARFTGVGFPINASESDIQSIVASPLPFDLSALLPVAAIGLFCLFIAGAVYYLRRRPGGSPFAGIREALARTPAGSRQETGAENDGKGTGADSSSGTPVPAQGTVPDMPLSQVYAGLLRSAGLGEASHAVYSELAGRIAHDLHISRHRVLTPREMSRSCRERPYCGPFARLVSVYERIRYGGHRSDPVREEFESTMQTTGSELGGELH